MKRLLAVVVCLLLLGSAVSCSVFQKKDGYEEVPKPYRDILEQYTDLLSQKEKNKKLSSPKKTLDQEKRAIREAIFAMVEDCEEPATMGYATKDINGDGVLELVLMDRSYELYGLFTLVEDKPVMLTDHEAYSIIDAEGTVYHYDSNEETGYRIQVKQLINGVLEGLEYGAEFGESQKDATYYLDIYGKRTEISKAEKMTLDDQYTGVVSRRREITKQCGFRFVSALGDDEQSDAPVLEVSNYDQILTMYQRIVEQYATYTKEKWLTGVYDGMYSFPDNRTYEIFNGVFCAGAAVRPTLDFQGTYDEGGHNAYGYAKLDMIGDDAEELILLTDSYEILAVFTMWEGRPKLLDWYDVSQEAWLDEYGRIHVDWYGNGGKAIGFRTYSFPDGDLRANVNVIWAPKPGSATEYAYFGPDENGRWTEMSNEEGKALRQFYKMESEYAGNYYMKAKTDLRFVPLFEQGVPNMRDRYAHLRLSSLKERSFSFSMDYIDYDETMTEYVVILAANAEWRDGMYHFENGTVSGTMEFGFRKVWITITESKDPRISCGPILYSAEKS